MAFIQSTEIRSFDGAPQDIFMVLEIVLDELYLSELTETCRGEPVGGGCKNTNRTLHETNLNEATNIFDTKQMFLLYKRSSFILVSFQSFSDSLRERFIGREREVFPPYNMT